LEKREVALPEPAAGQVLLRMHAAGLNRGEFIAGHGLTKPGAAKPAGMEGAGEVIKLGAGVTALKPGDKVMGRCAGAFAEFALMDAREAIAIPERLTWEQAAGIPLTFMVAQDMLIDQGKLAAGEWLLITGISSAVGVAALQTAKALGAHVIGTSGSADKLSQLKAFGLDLGIRTRSADFCAAVMAATGGKGVNLVVNNVGGSVFAECVRALAFQGRLATVGYVDGVLKAEMDIEALHAKRLKLFGVSNKLRSAEQKLESLRGFVTDILPAIAEGRVRPVMDQIYAFDDLPAAKAHMESNAQLGKIVVRMSPA
jgi:NADPH:quinone reductase-like Zn-dependent oxidoreductase